MYYMVTGYIHYTLYISYPWLILIIIGGSCLNGCGLLPTWTIEKDANLQLEISENIEVIFPIDFQIPKFYSHISD